MSLEDYFEVDLQLPNFPERVYGPPMTLEMMNDRIHYLKGTSNKSNNTLPVVYWMSRDQRLHDNWALLYAQRKALDHNLPFCIIFGLTSSFPGANIRSYGFMLRGLKLLQLECENYNIPFYILRGSPDDVVSKFCNDNNVGTLVTDFSPLNISKLWKRNISSKTTTKLQFIEVDAHNICPVRKVSNKCEFAAKTIRGKIHGLVSDYLTEFPAVQVMNENIIKSHIWISPDITSNNNNNNSHKSNNNNTSNDNENDNDSDSSNENISNHVVGNKEIWYTMSNFINSVDTSVPEVTWLESGEHAAMEALNDFLGIVSNEGNNNNTSSSSTTTTTTVTNRRSSRLDNFSEKRNDPSIIKGCSNLSPYLHYGQISSQRICLEVKRVKGFASTNALFPAGERTTGVHSFCEELVVRKELSDNYCFYNEHYSTLSGAHNWAQTTLQEHWNDEREVLYTEEQLESGKTGDDLWNAAQIEMVTTGKMHGFMRMYWAKKILEWTPNPDDALRIAIYLNDKYSLDGRDPNGYVGCMWAICGVHDRAWGPERPIFGKIRFMNYEGCKRKFNINTYIGMFLKSGLNSSKSSKTSKKK